MLRKPLVAVLPAGHVLARRDDVPLEALANKPLVWWPHSIGAAQLDAFRELPRLAAREVEVGRRPSSG